MHSEYREDIHSANIPGKACLLERQVEKFSRLILAAYYIEQDDLTSKKIGGNLGLP